MSRTDGLLAHFVAGEKTEYFQALCDERDNGGLAALMHFLKNYDISDFQPAVRPQAVMEGMLEQKLFNLSPVLSFIHHMLSSSTEEEWGTWMSKQNLNDQFYRFCASTQTPKVSVKALTIQLKLNSPLGFFELRRKRRVGGHLLNGFDLPGFQEWRKFVQEVRSLC